VGSGIVQTELDARPSHWFQTA